MGDFEGFLDLFSNFKLLDQFWTYQGAETLWESLTHKIFGGQNFLGVKIVGGQHFLGFKIFWGSKFEDFHQIFNSKLQYKLEFDFKDPV